MFDHLVLTVSKRARSVAFYRAVLGLGDGDERYLVLKKGEPSASAVHLAFRARSRKVVDAFHRAALAAGGRDHGAPGPRPQRFAAYCAAYVLDPDGYNVEAVYQG